MILSHSSVEALTLAWSSGVLDLLATGSRALYRAGHFVAIEDGVSLFALPSRVHRDRCEAKVAEVERYLAAHFGHPVPLRLVIEEDRPRADGPGGPVVADRDGFDEARDEDIGNARDLPDAPVVSTTGLELIQEAFPGAEVLE